MIRVVMDTNVLVSAIISSQGPNALVLDLALSGKVQPCISEALLEEYKDVLLTRPKFRRFDSLRNSRPIVLIEATSIKVAPNSL